MAAKGNKIEISTFRKYGKSDIIGYKTVDENGKTYVNFIWCKLCAKHKEAILSDPTLKGSVKASAKAFSEGTNVVTKYQVIKSLFYSIIRYQYVSLHICR